MKIYFVTFFILMTSFLFSQERNDSFSQGVNSFVNADVRPNGSGILVSGEVDPGIEGSPYLFKNWNTFAIIHISNGKKFTINNLNYDTKIDRFVSKVSLDSVYVFDASNLKEVTLNNKKFKRFDRNDRYEYFQLVALSKGKDILKKSIKLIKKGSIDPLTNKKNKDKYVNSSKYFLNSKNGIEEFKLKKKSFLKIFGNNSLKIKKFIKKEKLSIKNDEDIAKIFKYYNQL